MRERKLRVYDKEFKLNAVKFFLESGRSCSAISGELGIPTGTLATWVKNHKKDGKEAFPGKGHIKVCDKEVFELRKALAIAREERDILKKALGIFSLRKK